MEPSLQSGDYLILTKARSLRPGFIIALMHPRLGRMVKRITHIEGDEIYIAGDNRESTTAERLGVICVSDVLGRARWVITPRGMRRL